LQKASKKMAREFKFGLPDNWKLALPDSVLLAGFKAPNYSTSLWRSALGYGPTSEEITELQDKFKAKRSEAAQQQVRALYYDLCTDAAHQWQANEFATTTALRRKKRNAQGRIKYSQQDLVLLGEKLLQEQTVKAHLYQVKTQQQQELNHIDSLLVTNTFADRIQVKPQDQALESDLITQFQNTLLLGRLRKKELLHNATERDLGYRPTQVAQECGQQVSQFRHSSQRADLVEHLHCKQTIAKHEQNAKNKAILNTRNKLLKNS
jgi:hypothetical protein